MRGRCVSSYGMSASRPCDGSVCRVVGRRMGRTWDRGPSGTVVFDSVLICPLRRCFFISGKCLCLKSYFFSILDK